MERNLYGIEAFFFFFCQQGSSGYVSGSSKCADRSTECSNKTQTVNLYLCWLFAREQYIERKGIDDNQLRHHPQLHGNIWRVRETD